jgi:GMP synthase PP-ATPase subunit
MAKKFKLPRPAERPKKPIRELFATPQDVVKANRIAQKVLGAEAEVNYTAMPKNIGVMGDTGVRAPTPVISVGSTDNLRALLADPEVLAEAANRICNETGAACRVLLDLNPEAGHFEVEPTQDRPAVVE